MADIGAETLSAFIDIFWRSALFLGHAAVVGGGALSLLLKRPSTTRGRLQDMALGERKALPALTFLFFALSLGLAVNMLALFALGMVGWFTPRALLWAALALFLLGVVALAMFFEPRRAPAPHGWGGKSALEGLALLALYSACLLASLHPPGIWDDTLYHLPLARLYVEEHRIVFSEYIRYSLFPQNMNVLMAVGLMWGGVVGAQALATLPLFVMAVGLTGFSRQVAGVGAPGLFAALLLFLLKPLTETVGYAYVDIGLALFCWAATYAFLLATRPDARHAGAWTFLAGAFVGAAMGIKLTAMVMAALLGLMLLWHARSQPGPVVLRRVLLYALGVLVAGAGWYVRSAWISGDPIHPAGAPLFGYFLWNEVDYAWQKSQVMTQSSLNPLNLLQVLAENGVVLWVAALAGVVFWRHMPGAIRVLYGIFFLYFVFWFVVTQVDRYLAPVAAAGMFLSVHALWNVLGLNRRYVQWAGAVAVLICTGLLANTEAGKAHSRMQHWDHMLNIQPGYRLMQQANARIPEHGARLLQLGFESQAYFFQGTMIGDWFGPGRYWDLMHCTATCGTMVDSATMAELMRKHGARMLVFGRHMDRDFDPATYQDRFDLVYEDEEGVLMVLRPQR